ncbi:hypothetical protein E8L99_06390 [Phreatobacter aquaticus]|uniref:Uncharacterized protein n=1 Tax=Phreatobacter aquaticus TaxID=2570229 RepID=A0A4D7QI55_9HYPH|nr:hypothetical protein [Phreatobacter aquaticus]QCK85423.1 hypothetical protein E8L99_06390 [Phreatobacter aquaticus]
MRELSMFYICSHIASMKDCSGDLCRRVFSRPKVAGSRNSGHGGFRVVRQGATGNSLGCDFSDIRYEFDTRRHVNWCMSQSANQMRTAPALHHRNLAARCSRSGVTFTR